MSNRDDKIEKLTDEMNALFSGQPHYSDYVILTGEGCSFVYGSPPNHSICKNKVGWEIKSGLRAALTCDEHKEELLTHHRYFDKNATAETIDAEHA